MSVRPGSSPTRDRNASGGCCGRPWGGIEVLKQRAASAVGVADRRGERRRLRRGGEQRADPGCERGHCGSGADLQQAAQRDGNHGGNAMGRGKRLERRQTQLVRDRHCLALELRAGDAAGRVGAQHCSLELGELVVEIEQNPATGALTAARNDCHRYL